MVPAAAPFLNRAVEVPLAVMVGVEIVTEPAPLEVTRVVVLLPPKVMPLGLPRFPPETLGGVVNTTVPAFKFKTPLNVFTPESVSVLVLFPDLVRLALPLIMPPIVNPALAMLGLSVPPEPVRAMLLLMVWVTATPFEMIPPLARVNGLPPIMKVLAPALKVMPLNVKPVSSLFGVVDPTEPNTSESPLATGPEPDE